VLRNVEKARMGRAKEIQRHMAYALQNVHWWGFENVVHTMLSVPDVPTAQEFNKRWRLFNDKVFRKISGGRWMRFMELQRRGSPHAHIIHYWPNVREGCVYEQGAGWKSKGIPLRDCIRAVNECKESYGFGWNTSEPLRGANSANVEGLVKYLVKYANKSRYMGRDTVFEGCRMVTFGQGCIERHGCTHDPRYPECHEKRWVKSSPAKYEVIGESFDRAKRQILAFYCQEVGIEVDELGMYAESRRPTLKPAWALFLLWRDEISPMWANHQICPF